MANRMNAVSTYRPKINLGQLVQTPELSLYIARGTALNRGEIGNVLDELNEAVIFYALQGRLNYPLIQPNSLSHSARISGATPSSYRWGQLD